MNVVDGISGKGGGLVIRWWWTRLRRHTVAELASVLAEHAIVLRHSAGVVCACHTVYVNDAAWALHVAEKQAG